MDSSGHPGYVGDADARARLTLGGRCATGRYLGHAAWGARGGHANVDGDGDHPPASGCQRVDRRSAERVRRALALRNRAAAIRRAIPHGLAQVMSSSGPLRGYPGCSRRHLGTGLSTISASTVRNPVRSSRRIAQWAALATHAPSIAPAYPRHRLHLAFRPCSTSLPGSARPVPSRAGGGSRRAPSPRLHRSRRGRVVLDAITN